MKNSGVQRTAFAAGIVCLLVLVMAAISQNRPPYATPSQAAPSEATPPQATAPHPVSNTVQPSSDEQALFDAVNRERIAEHVQPLQWDSILARAARSHAVVMSRNGDLSHQYPGEPSLEQRAAQAGARFANIAENVALGPDAAEIHDGWMHSPGHRKNILDPDVTALGIAVVRGHYSLYAVQDFSRPVPDLTVAQQEQKLISLLSPIGLNSAQATDDARRTCAIPSGYSGRPSEVLRYETPDLSKLPDELIKTLHAKPFHRAEVGACPTTEAVGFVRFRFALLLY
ncbi:MAG: CAP domain-containing protein [Candidatus Acidiferrum sp.]|jgi:uncharacterized protein YkwD